MPLRKYTADQEERIWAQYAAGAGLAEIQRRMQSGADGEKPFEIPYRSVKTVIERLEAKRGVPMRTRVNPEDIPAALDAIAARGVAILDAQLTRAEKRARVGRLTLKETRELSHLIRLSRQAREYWRGGNSKPLEPVPNPVGKSSKGLVGKLRASGNDANARGGEVAASPVRGAGSIEKDPLAMAARRRFPRAVSGAQNGPRVGCRRNP